MRQGIMLAHKLDESRLARMPQEVLFQPKLNGVRCKAVVTRINYNIYDVQLFSSQANKITFMRHIEDALYEMCCKADIHSVTFDGELFCYGMKLQDICSRVKRTASPHPDAEAISYHIFDTISDAPQAERTAVLSGIMNHAMWPLQKVPTYFAEKDKWPYYFKLFVELGAEGVIIRNPDGQYETKRSANLLKYKTIIKNRFEITAFLEEISIDGEPKGQLGALNLRAENGEIFSCGASMVAHHERTLWWVGVLDKSIKPENYLAVVRYPELTKRGVPHMPVLVRFEREEPC